MRNSIIFHPTARPRKGASLLGYGLIIGLVGVIALGAIGDAGDSVNGMFTDVADTLADVGGGASGSGASPAPSASASASASPSPPNQPPVFSGNIGNLVLTQGQTISPITVNGYLDADGDSLTYSMLGSWPGGLSLVKVNDTAVQITGTPASAASYTGLSILADDGNGGSVASNSFDIAVNAPDPCDGSPSIGTLCSDGSIYAGISPDGNQPMYVTRCDYGFAWNGVSCGGARIKLPWNDGSQNWLDTALPNCADWTSSAAACVDGDGLTAQLVGLDSSSQSGTQVHRAARACDELTIHGHSDWYLPSIKELRGPIYDNRFSIGNFDTSGSGAISRYWASSEWNDYIGYHPNFSTGDLLTTTVPKDIVLNIRCARK